MKYYSDKTRKLYDTEEDLLKAEELLAQKEIEEKKKMESRKSRAKEVEDAYKHYLDLLDKFIKDYGSFHTTLTQLPKSLFDFWF